MDILFTVGLLLLSFPFIRDCRNPEHMKKEGIECAKIIAGSTALGSAYSVIHNSVCADIGPEYYSHDVCHMTADERANYPGLSSKELIRYSLSRGGPWYGLINGYITAIASRSSVIDGPQLSAKDLLLPMSLVYVGMGLSASLYGDTMSGEFAGKCPITPEGLARWKKVDGAHNAAGWALTSGSLATVGWIWYRRRALGLKLKKKSKMSLDSEKESLFKR